MQDYQKQWQKFLNGEIEAFEKILQFHFRDLYYYGSKFSKDPEFVKDAIQDLFLTLWEKRENLGNDVPVKAYLMASLRRIMHRSSKINARIPSVEIDNSTHLFEVDLSVEQKLIETETDQIRVHKIKKSIEELPARQKEVIYLKFFQEMDRGQIADIMGISPQTVSNLLQIALGQLKKHFKVEFLTLLFVFFE